MAEPPPRHITVLDVFRDLRIEPEPRATWAVGAAVRDIYGVGMLPGQTWLLGRDRRGAFHARAGATDCPGSKRRMAMKQLVFMGSGDDTFGEMTTGFDYDNSASCEPIVFRVSGKDDQGRPVAMLVIGQYCPAFYGAESTGWMIGVARAHDPDDVPLPSWPMRFERSDAPYSPQLVIEVPDDVTVETAMSDER